MRALLFLFLPFTVAAQSPSFQYFEAANQLSQQHINCQQVDDQGFLWIGTQDGLNRFDAYQYHTFWHDKNDTTSLSNHFIWCLLNDSKYGLWVGTYGGGLNYYDSKKETFTSFYPSAENAVRSVRSMEFLSPDTLLVGTDRGYWSFAAKTRKFLPQDSVINAGLSSVTALHRVSARWLLVGATEGLYLIDRHKKLKHELSPETPIRLVTDIKPIGNEIWVCGSPGLVRLQYRAEDDLVHIVGQSRPKSITNEHRLANACTQILEDDQGTIWVGALGRLYQVKLEEDTLQWIPQSGLPDQQINSLLQIEPNLISVGTREGLLKTTTAPPIFKTKTPANEPNLCSSVILGLDQASSGDWWIGTKEGLFYQDDTGQHSECLSPENTPGMPVPYVINVRALENEIWATFWRGGLGRIRSTELGWAVDTIPGLYDLVQGAGMHDIIKDSAGKYWIASPNRGVIRWDPASSNFSVYEPNPLDSSSLSSPYVFHLFFDHKEQLWISTANGGVCCLDPQTEIIQCFQQTENSDRSLASNIVLSTYQDQKERIWFCTAAGLSLLLDDGSIRNFGKRDGLPNEVVYGMLEDTQGNLWISTNGGLCRISEESDEWVFQNFTVEDGLQSNEFNQYSFHQSTSGQLYFGGSVGLTQFDPIRVKPSSYHPPLTITRFLLFNKEQRAQTSSVLDHSIQWTERIPLSHHQNFLAFEFAALGFQQSQNQAYAYRLVGLEEEWIQAENRRFAAYPNLAPGNYRFEVKATNHDGIWSAETKGIDIHIKQPWWKQWWAILLWTSLLLGLIRMIILNRENTIRRIEQAKLQEREAFRKRSAQDFHDEAGNRITKLSLLTEVARRQKPAQDAILNQIQEHIQSLRSGMRDFIWVLDPEQDQLADLYQRLIRMGNQLFEHTNIQFHPRPIPEKAATWVVPGYQRRHLLMIFQEATNNVVKYAQCQNVYLGISINGNQVSIWLKDDGQGFILGETEGYGIRNMKERAQKIDGRLQIDSTLGQQTQVSLSWNIPQMGD